MVESKASVMLCESGLDFEDGRWFQTKSSSPNVILARRRLRADVFRSTSFSDNLDIWYGDALTIDEIRLAVIKRFGV